MEDSKHKSALKKRENKYFSEPAIHDTDFYSKSFHIRY
jgi:hypothetical protein